MNKETIKAFIAWLETASDEEMQHHRIETLENLSKVSSREGKSDVNLALRLLDEEVIARLQMKLLKK